MTDEPRPRARRRLRISVRALMGVVLVLAVGLGFYVRGVHVQQDAVAAIKQAGGSVQYNWHWRDYHPDIEDYDGKWRTPKWLARLVPVDYLATVTHVAFNVRRRTRRADDEVLVHVGRLRHLEGLGLDGAAITDAGLAHLEGLSRLQDLRIARTNAGDAGLAHLRGLTGLTSVWISGDRITDEARLDLERALPGLRIYRLEEMVTFDIGHRQPDALDLVRSQPVRLAAALLVDRARSMAERRDVPAFIATVDALCDLDADNKLSLVKLAEARGECLGVLEPRRSPNLPAPDRQRLRRRCADRGIDALTRAVELGYDNLRRLDGGLQEMRMLWSLHDHPTFPKVVEAAKANRGKG